MQEDRETRKIVIGLILLVLDGAEGWESGESVSLLSRTPKACASRQFLDCASCRFSPRSRSALASAIFTQPNWDGNQLTIGFSARFLITPLGENIVDDFSVHVCQAAFDTVVVKTQAFVLEA